MSRTQIPDETTKSIVHQSILTIVVLLIKATQHAQATNNTRVVKLYNKEREVAVTPSDSDSPRGSGGAALSLPPTVQYKLSLRFPRREKRERLGVVEIAPSPFLPPP